MPSQRPPRADGAGRRPRHRPPARISDSGGSHRRRFGAAVPRRSEGRAVSGAQPLNFQSSPLMATRPSGPYGAGRLTGRADRDQRCDGESARPLRSPGSTAGVMRVDSRPRKAPKALPVPQRGPRRPAPTPEAPPFVAGSLRSSGACRAARNGGRRRRGPGGRCGAGIPPGAAPLSGGSSGRRPRRQSKPD